jgi:hypothetical protein
MVKGRKQERDQWVGERKGKNKEGEGKEERKE